MPEFIKTKKGREEIWSWEETTETQSSLETYWAGVATRNYWGSEGGEVVDEG